MNPMLTGEIVNQRIADRHEEARVERLRKTARRARYQRPSGARRLQYPWWGAPSRARG